MGAHGSKRLRSDLEALRSNDPTLQSLCYEQVGLGDEGARALAQAIRGNSALRRLQLGQCSLSAAGMRRLCAALCDPSIVPCRLRKLELSTSSTPPLGNPIGDEGAKYLAELLTRTSSLHHLRAANCDIGDEGAVSIAKALAGNKSLKTLDLSCNSISDIGAEQLGSALASNHSLQGLSLWSNRIFHSGAEALASGLTSNTTLRWLGLGCNHIGDEGVKAIAIALLSNAQGSQLVWLALGGNHVTDRGAEHLAVALKAQLSSPQGPAVTLEENIGESASQASLTEQIRLGGLRPMLELGVTPSHVSVAVEEREEGEGRGEGVGEDEVDGGMVYCIPLESLGLGGNQISDTGAQSLAEGLASNTKLLSLGLADNRVGDEGASSLADLLRRTDTLQRLVLSGNDIHDHGGSKLVAALSQNRSLKGLYLAGNPFGDAVSERCREVVGRYNTSLEVLDLHDTRMSTPAVSSLVESMRKERVLRTLGSQPVPQEGEKGNPLPASGNILELEEWRPRSHEAVLQRRGPVFSRATPSQRMTTVEALGSLPPPEESAQALVVKAGQEGRRPRRRSSISEFLGRMSLKRSRIFSRKDVHDGSSEQTNERVLEPRKPRNAQTSSGIELQPLVEEAGEGEGEGEELGALLRSPTLLVGQPVATVELVRDSELVRESELLRASEVQVHVLDTDTSFSGDEGEGRAATPLFYDPELDVVERGSSLRSLTKHRPRPPPSRQPPSRERSPRHSPRQSVGVERIGGITTLQEGERIGGITTLQEGEREPFTYDAANRMLASATPILHSEDPAMRRPSVQEEKPLKEQWSVALAMRVGMLKMGGFLHSGFDAVTAADSSHSHDYTYAMLPRNAAKNREEAPLPPAHTRVKLQLVFEEVGSDYINASFVGSPSYPKSFIITQGPTESTTPDFWRLVWEHRVSVVVVLTPEQEERESFWPREGGSEHYSLVDSGCWLSDALTVTTEGERPLGGVAEAVIRHVTLESSVDRDSDHVTLFHYRGWPQHGVPESARDVARLFHMVLQARQRQAVSSPVVVVSSLGAGRAGCFCSVGVAYELLRSPEEAPQSWEHESNILDQVIRGLRRCRGGLVETQQQFEFCHRVLEEALWGRVEGEETDGRGERRGWRKLFGGRRKGREKPQKRVGKGKGGRERKLLEEEEDRDDIQKQLLY